MASQKKWRQAGSEIMNNPMGGLGTIGGGLLDLGETAITGLLGQVNPMFAARLKAEDELEAANALAQRKGAFYNKLAQPVAAQQAQAAQTEPFQQGTMSRQLANQFQQAPQSFESPGRTAQQGRPAYGQMNSAQMEQALGQSGIEGLSKLGGGIMADRMAKQTFASEALNNDRAKREWDSNNYSDVKIDPLDGTAFGQNKVTGRFERLEGEAMNVDRATVNDKLEKERYALEDRMSGNYNKLVNKSMTVIDQYDSMRSSAHNSIGDKNLLLSFYKIKDPTSVVSGNEEATAKNAPGWTAEMRNLYNRIFRGGELPQPTRDEFMQFGLSESNRARENIRRQQRRFTKSATDRQIDPSFLFSDRTFEDLAPLTVQEIADKEAAKPNTPTVENVVRATIGGRNGRKWKPGELDQFSLEELRSMKEQELARRAKENAK